MAEYIIELKKVTKHYEMGENIVKALDGIGIQVSKGDFVAIMGPSGSGKSTAMNLVGSLDLPTQGTIYLDNQDISHLEESELAQLRGKKIGFIFQSFNLMAKETVFENVTKARSALLSAKSPKEAAAAENMLTGALKTLFAISEAYPNLRASENFKELQEELSDTETKIAASRQFYNANVLDYNTKIQTFPGNIFANSFGFKVEEFFGVTEEEKKNIEVKF